jgi:hypothetical protein
MFCVQLHYGLQFSQFAFLCKMVIFKNYASIVQFIPSFVREVIQERFERF